MFKNLYYFNCKCNFFPVIPNMTSLMKMSLILYGLFCIFSAILAPRNSIQECAEKISSVFKSDLPLENFIEAYTSYTEDKFTGENALSQEAYGYYKDLLNNSNFERLLNMPSPLEFCRNVRSQNDHHTIWSLPEYGIYQKADNEQACIESLKKIGCEKNMSGIEAFRHLYLHGDEDEIELTKIYPNWRTEYGNENTNDPKYIAFLNDLFNMRITWIYWYLYDLANYYKFHHFEETFRNPIDYCENPLPN